MIREAAIVPLPHGVTAIRDVAATDVTRNPMGAVRLELREGWFRYRVDYNSRLPAADAPPTEDDLGISEPYRETFSDLAVRLGLREMPPEEIVARIRGFFADGFTYTLTQRQRYPRGQYLAEFVNHTRSGHCEYFATSTVLLLRAAGIPARYVVGYGIDEYSPLERQYIGRARHAHSWALAYIDGAWTTLDTTPSVWAPLEAEQASALQPLFDLWSWITFRLSRTQAAEVEEADDDNTFLLWLLPPLLLVLVWRLYVKERVSRRAGSALRPEDMRRPGLDSELYAVIAALEQQGHVRPPGETLPRWFDRRAGTDDDAPWLSALALHTRYRFDPGGLDGAERTQLARDAASLLQRMQRGRAPAT
jgi:hypothetical protein